MSVNPSTLWIVESKAGSDRGTLYWVMDQSGKRLTLTDAKRHPISHPKFKNPKHCRICDLDGWEAVGGEKAFSLIRERLQAEQTPESERQLQAQIKKRLKWFKTKGEGHVKRRCH